MNIYGLLEWVIITFPFIISIVSLIISIKYKKRFWHIISGCINFALAVYVPMCMFSYFYHANFIGKDNETDIEFLIKELANNSDDAWRLLIFIFLVTSISIFNCLNIFKMRKEKR